MTDYQRKFLLFSLLLVFTLTLGSSLALHSFEFVLYHIIFYSISFYVLSTFGYQNDFFKSFHNIDAFKDKTILFAGSDIKVKSLENNKDDQFIDLFDAAKSVKRTFLSFFLMGLGFVVFHFYHKIPLSLPLTIPLFLVYFIINVTTSGHLLIPLLLNLTLVVGYYQSTETKILYLLYAFLFILSLAYLGHIRDDGLKRKAAQFFEKKRLMTLALFTLLLLSLFFVSTYFLPDRIQKQFQPERIFNKQHNSSEVKYLKESRKDLVSLRNRLETLGSVLPEGLVNSISNQLSKSQVLESKIQTSSSGQYAQDIENFAKGMDDLSKDVELFQKQIDEKQHLMRKIESLNNKEILNQQDQNSLTQLMDGLDQTQINPKINSMREKLKTSGSQDVSQEELKEMLKGLSSIASGAENIKINSVKDILNEDLQQAGISPQEQEKINQRMVQLQEEISNYSDKGEATEISQDSKEVIDLLKNSNISEINRKELSEKINQIDQKTQDLKDELVRPKESVNIIKPNGEKISQTEVKKAIQQLEKVQDKLVSPSQSSKSNELSQDIQQLKEKLENPDETSLDRKEISQALQNIENKKQKLHHIDNANKLFKNSQEHKEQALDQANNKNNKLLEKIFKHYKLIGFFIILFVVRHFLSKKSINKIETVHDEDLPKLRDEWRKAKKLKLSPNEEVIHFYNLFQKTIQTLRYNPAEAPPSCIIYQDISEQLPELQKASYALTEIFAQCYYGNKNVPIKTLKTFRAALKKLLAVYRV